MRLICRPLTVAELQIESNPRSHGYNTRLYIYASISVISHYVERNSDVRCQRRINVALTRFVTLWGFFSVCYSDPHARTTHHRHFSCCTRYYKLLGSLDDVLEGAASAKAKNEVQTGWSDARILYGWKIHPERREVYMDNQLHQSRAVRWLHPVLVLAFTQFLEN